MQPSVEPEIERASEQFHAARTRGDAAAFAALFTDDGVFMVPGLSDASGRDAVRTLAEKRFAGLTTSNFRIDRREIDVAGDTAYETAWYAETDQRGDQATRMRGRYVIVWKREAGGAWRVHRYLYSFSGATPVS